MRIKDEIKQEALFEATIKVVNEIGFASSSVSKIAKEAGISPATIYIYHENKEDLLVSTYMKIKSEFSQAMLQGFDDSQPIRDIFKKLWINAFDYVAKHKPNLNFTEQFANSPYSDLIDKEEISKYFEPIYSVLTKGIEQKIIKDLDVDLLGVFIFYPVLILSNKRLCSTFEASENTINKAFEMAWDAIKL